VKRIAEKSGSRLAFRSHRFAVRTRELPNSVRPPDWPAPLRGANQSFDLTFCPVNRASRAHCQGKKSVNSRVRQANHMSDIIDEAFKKAFARYGSIKNINFLPPIIANFLLVHDAQGVIDNGGYRYFFGSNWPNNPPYSRFVDAYIAIGCKKQARDMERVVNTFPFENPHLHETRRSEYIKANFDEDSHEVKGWGDALCGDEEVWEKLREYYLKNKPEFA